METIKLETLADLPFLLKEKTDLKSEQIESIALNLAKTKMKYALETFQEASVLKLLLVNFWFVFLRTKWNLIYRYKRCLSILEYQK